MKSKGQVGLGGGAFRTRKPSRAMANNVFSADLSITDDKIPDLIAKPFTLRKSYRLPRRATVQIANPILKTMNVVY